MAGSFLNKIYSGFRTGVLPVSFLLISFILFLGRCTDTPNELQFLNHSDTVDYTGMQTCISCHADKASTYMFTGMGQSFHHAGKSKSTAAFGKNHVVFDSFSNLYYYPFWRADSLYIREFRLEGNDTVHKLEVKIDYIIGSGQHTNSHIYKSGSYIYQAPLTFYVQDGKWDLPPGYENGNNSRFNRILNVECLSCHNAMPEMKKGSDYQFESIGTGIDCERCHGPGEIHVSRMLEKKKDEPGKPSIVNPSKLSWERQIDLCQRCHLQGLNLLKQGRTFTDFRPGMQLSDVFDIYLPEFEGNAQDFDMANHAARFQKSQCFIEGNKEQLTFTCITCHNPHVSVKHTGTELFNRVCANCHKPEACTAPAVQRNEIEDNCVECHMPSSGVEDIPHVSVHDHLIKKPLGEKEREKVKKLIGLYAVNNPEPNPTELIRAYLEYFEKFDKNPFFLNKAKDLLKAHPDPMLMGKYHYLKDDFVNVIANYEKHSYELDHWSAYMLAESYNKTGNEEKSLQFFRLSYRMSESDLPVALRYLQVAVKAGQYDEVRALGEHLLDQMPYHAKVPNALAVLCMATGEMSKSYQYMKRAFLLDPDDLSIWETHLNYFIRINQKTKARIWADKILLNYPDYPYKKDIEARLN